jgi:sugar phosphate isomerase/epimerase
MWIWGYNTNGTGNRPLEIVIPLLADLGYRSIAITLDDTVLNPYSKNLREQLARVDRLLRRHALASFIETGARYLLDPGTKHEPTLVSPDAAARQFRCEFLKRSLAIARDLGSQGVSFWSGCLHPNDPREERQIAGDFRRHVEELLVTAERYQTSMALEAEPSMYVERNSDVRGFVAALDSPYLGVTIDVGHLHCLSEPWDEVSKTGSRIKNVHMEDMLHGDHEHRMFGDGDIPFDKVFSELRKAEYQGCINLELSRHGHAFPEVAAHSLSWLRAALDPIADTDTDARMAT